MSFRQAQGNAGTNEVEIIEEYEEGDFEDEDFDEEDEEEDEDEEFDGQVDEGAGLRSIGYFLFSVAFAELQVQIFQLMRRTVRRRPHQHLPLQERQVGC